MTITWHGQYTVKILTQGTTIVIDPHSASAGQSGFKSKAEYVALTNPELEDMSYVGGVQGQPQIINTPGEFAFDQVTLHARGWHDDDHHEHSILRMTIEGATLLHLGALNRPIQASERQELEQTNIDILFLPIGGDTGLNTTSALELLSVIEPSIVIPINYHTSKTKQKLDTVDTFAKAMSIDPKQSDSKLSITGKKIDRENLTAIMLAV